MADKKPIVTIAPPTPTAPTASIDSPTRTRNPPRPVHVPEPLPAPTWTAVLSPDPTEHALLATLRATPAEPDARMVYADWLERAGRDVCASAVRGVAKDTLVELTEVGWRAIAACAAIQACNVDACPRRWSSLAAIDGDERSRTCTTCNTRVYYGDSEATIVALGSNRAKYAPDAAHDGRAHIVYYHRGKPRRF